MALKTLAQRIAEKRAARATEEAVRSNASTKPEPWDQKTERRKAERRKSPTSSAEKVTSVKPDVQAPKKEPAPQKERNTIARLLGL